MKVAERNGADFHQESADCKKATAELVPLRNGEADHHPKKLEAGLAASSLSPSQEILPEIKNPRSMLLLLCPVHGPHLRGHERGAQTYHHERVEPGPGHHRSRGRHRIQPWHATVLDPTTA